VLVTVQHTFRIPLFYSRWFYIEEWYYTKSLFVCKDYKYLWKYD